MTTFFRLVVILFLVAGRGLSRAADIVDPNANSVSVTLFAQAQAADWVRVSINGNEIYGEGDEEICTHYIEMSEASFQLMSDRVYMAKIEGSAVYDVKFGMAAANTGDQDNDYWAYYYDRASGRWTKFCDGVGPGWNVELDGDPEEYCGTPNATIPIIVRKELKRRPWAPPGPNISGERDSEFGTWTRDEGYGDPSKSPGDETPLALSHVGEFDPSAIGIRWSVELGRLWDASSAGRLQFAASRLAPASFTAAALSYTARSGDSNLVEVLPRPDLFLPIQQIKTPQLLVNVISNSAASFQLELFSSDKIQGRGTNGYFQAVTNSLPFVIWKFDSPASSSNSFRIIELRRAYRTNESILTFNPTNGLWTLTRGASPDVRVEKWTINTNIASGITNRVERVEVGDGTNITEKIDTAYQLFNWGFEQVASTNDPGGLNLVTAYTYGTDPDSAAYSKLLMTVYPDGFWEERFYEDDGDSEFYGRPILIRRPWMDGYVGPEDYKYSLESYDYLLGRGPGAYAKAQYYDAYGETRGPEATRIYAEVNDYYFPCTGGSTYTEEQEIGSLSHYGDYIKTEVFSGIDVLAGKISSRLGPGTTATPGSKDSFEYTWGTVSNFTFTVSGSGTSLRQSVYHGADYRSGGEWDLVEYGSSGSAISALGMRPHRSTKDVYLIDNGFLRARQKWVFTGGTNFSQLEELRIERDALGHVTNAFRYNSGTGLPSQSLYQADWAGTNSYPGNRKISETDAAGLKTTFAYDNLGRVKARVKVGASLAGYPAQADITETVSYDASDRVLSTVSAGGGLATTNLAVWDRAGRVTLEVGAERLTNSYAYALGGRQVSISTGSGATKTNLFYLDRRLKSVTGTAEVNKFYTYDVTGWASASSVAHAGRAVERVGAVDSARWRQTVHDTRGVESAEFWPLFRSEESGYKEFQVNSGLDYRESFLTASTYHSDENPNFWAVDFGRLNLTQRDSFHDLVAQGQQRTYTGMALSGPLALASLQQMSRFTNYYATNAAGDWFFVNQEFAYLTDGDAAGTLLKSIWTRASGFASNQVSEAIEIDLNTNVLTTAVWLAPADRLSWQTMVLTNPAAADIQRATNVTLNGLLQSESTFSVAAPAWHYYDGLGREMAARDALGNVSGTRLDPSTGQALAVTNTVGEVTSFSYYPGGVTGAGLKKSETNPAGKVTYFGYNTRGELIRTWGDVPYPEERTYDTFGDLVALGTFQGGLGWGGASWPSGTTGATNLTLFKYDEATGLLTNKIDAAGAVTAYNYYETHELLGVTWSRLNDLGEVGVGYTNYLSFNGDLEATRYSDGAVVSFTNHNRLGLPRQLTDASGTHVLTYDAQGRQVSDQCTNGLLAGITLTNSFNYIGRSAMSLLGASSTLNWSYGYDSARRLSSITNGSLTASYTYWPNSDLVQTMTGKSNTTTVLTTTRQWESGHRLKSIDNKLGGTTTISATSYNYDTRGRRMQAQKEDGSWWQYHYNDRDEVTSGKRYWSDFTPVAGQQFEYNYDAIGNRLWTKSGGDENGENLRYVDYDANALNQITTRTNASSVDILGAALVGATNLTVNGSSTLHRHGEYYQKSLSVANTTTAISQPVTNQTTYAGTTTTVVGSLLVPKVKEEFTYDTDGNLLSDSLWHYKWDAANRLIEMTNSTALANSNRLKLAFTYDYSGRRVRKQVFPWISTNWSTSASTNLKFAYDGWLLLAELSDTTLIRTYTWGLDLNGEMYDDAGGIGGLVFNSEGATNFFPMLSDRGDVTQIVCTDTVVVSSFEYGPFGEAIRSGRAFATANPFRATTKIADVETGLQYYGYRYFNTSSGRWINRDPIGESGGLNLYGFVNNSPMANVDAHGLFFGLVDLVIENSGEIAQKTYQVKRAQTLLQRIRAGIKALDNLQEFQAGVMEAEGLDISDLVHSINAARGALAENLRGASSGKKAAALMNDLHHIFPQADSLRKFFTQNKININGVLLQINGYLHRFGVHRPGGGPYNQIWAEFAEKNRKMKDKPYYVMGFGFGLIHRISSLLY